MRLRVAVVGLGVGEQHARAYLRTGLCELAWLHDLDHERAKRLATELGASGVAYSFEQILADTSIDVISIASYDADHFGQVLAALHAGKHVFVEKPICRTSQEVRQVREAWMASGRPQLALSSNLVLRAAPLYQRLRRALEDGLLGRVYAIDGEYLYGRFHKIIHGWRGHEPGYSVMAGGGVHMVDLALWLTGQRPLTIQAIGNRICSEGTCFQSHDYVTTLAAMSGGAIARFTANFGCVHRHQHVLRIYGTEGTFLFDDAGARMHCGRNPELPPEPWVDSPLPASKGDLIPDFIEGIRQGRDWGDAISTCLDVVTVCVACDEALSSNTTIKVQYT